MEKIIGYVEHIVFRNEDNGYTVFHLHNEDGDLTCVGMFHYISEESFWRYPENIRIMRCMDRSFKYRSIG